MVIDDKLISKLEHLARLELSATDRGAIAKDLTGILAMVEKLSELDVGGVEPLRYVHDQANPLRSDGTGPPTSRDEALKNAPGTDGLNFRVPKVIG
jgi:aspartyl-tRNA(Asn)/glutamyl-tRNA(Gln) amidotransferase subunit C